MKLGYVDVDKMLNEVSWLKFLEWQAYAELEPFDEIRADLRSAQIVATINNLFRGKGESPRPITDFLLKFVPKKFKQTQTMQEQKNIAWLIATAFASKGKK